jgi:hypothetical protein
MKRNTTLFCALFPILSFGNSDTLKKPNSYSVSFSASNNGQIEKIVIEDFYDHHWYLLANYNTSYYSIPGNEIGNKVTPWRSYICWNGRFQINLNRKEISTGIQVSYQNRFEAIQEVSRDSFAESIEQKIIRASIFVQKNCTYKKFGFSPGIEIPFYYLGTHYQRGRDAYWSGFLPGPPHRQEGVVTTPGGFAIGLNAQFIAQYNFRKWFSVYAQTCFGILYAQGGGDVTTEVRFYDYSTGQYGPTNSYANYAPRRMKRWFFSPPMVGMGVMVNI